MQCTICGAEAKNLAPGYFDGLVVSCKHCGEYTVTGSAVNDLLRLDFEARLGALEKARRAAAPDEVPKIDTGILETT
jgi:hypothetical protein